MDRLQKTQIIFASAAAFILAILTFGTSPATFTPLAQSLEALSFLLSAAAVYSSATALRARYEALGLDKEGARRSRDYMRKRSSVRWWSYFAVLAMGSVAAPHFNISQWFAVALLAVVLPPTIFIVDQLTGWRGSSTR